MSMMASQITGISIVCSTVGSGTNQRKHQNSASLAFVREIHQWLVNSPHKGPVMRNMFPFDDIMYTNGQHWISRWLGSWLAGCSWLNLGQFVIIRSCSCYSIYIRADSRFAPSQWEMLLLCNDVSHWLGTSLESTLYMIQWQVITLNNGPVLLT